MAAHSTAGSVLEHCTSDHRIQGHSSVEVQTADTEAVHSLEPVMAHNCCSSLVQEGSLVADFHTVEIPVCSSHNHQPDGKNGAEGPASGPSPYLLVVVAVDSRHRVESMAYSEVEALLEDIHMAVVENVAPTEKLHHDPEGGDAADHSHQIELYFLEMSDS